MERAQKTLEERKSAVKKMLFKNTLNLNNVKVSISFELSHITRQ